MVDYMGKIHALFHEFNELLPLASTIVEEIKQRPKFFMILALHRLVDKYFYVHDQILGSPVVPILTFTCSTLLHVPSKSINDTSVSVYDSSTLTS